MVATSSVHLSSQRASFYLLPSACCSGKLQTCLSLSLSLQHLESALHPIVNYHHLTSSKFTTSTIEKRQFGLKGGQYCLLNCRETWPP